MGAHALETAPAAAAGPARGAITARTFEDFEALRGRLEAVPWERLDPVPEYFRTVVEVRSEVRRPHVVLDGDAAFVGRVEDVRLPVAAGYRTLWAPRARALTMVLGGVAGVVDDDAADELVARLRAELARGEADVALLPSLPAGSPLARAVARVPALARGHGARPRTHWRLRLPPTFDEFRRSRSKRTRDNLRVYGNRLARERGELALRIFRSPGEIDELFRDVGPVAAATYQHALGTAFADTPEHRALTALGLARGWFRVYVLYAEDEPIAFWPGAAWGGTFFVGTPGYRPEVAHLSVGTQLLARVIEDLCADERVHTLDYGSGDAEYKRRFGSESWEEVDLVLFAPRVRPAGINLTRTALGGAVGLVRRIAAGTGLEGRLRRRLRARLGRAR